MVQPLHRYDWNGVNNSKEWLVLVVEAIRLWNAIASSFQFRFVCYIHVLSDFSNLYCSDWRSRCSWLSHICFCLSSRLITHRKTCISFPHWKFFLHELVDLKLSKPLNTGSWLQTTRFARSFLKPVITSEYSRQGHRNGQPLESYSRSSSTAARFRHFSPDCVSEQVDSDTACVSISSLAIISSYLLCGNCVARCIVAHSLEEMVSQIKMRSDSFCRYWIVPLIEFLSIDVRFKALFRCIS